ncbi:hypothetical protein [Streptomyces sp. NPDC090022]|uniref:hypothetical protein n=1 Tax=Streptomyces sp. NPDC090022 TaxID=3365920 RepID=UPI00382077AD
MIVRPDVAALLRAGLSNAAIARELRTAPRRVQVARVALGITNPHGGGASTASPEELFWARTTPLPGGHLRWTGHVSNTGSFKIHWGGRNYSPHKIAFRIRTGRDPVGKAKTSCGIPGCVAPAHVDDAEDRARLNATYNALFGGTP